MPEAKWFRVSRPTASFVSMCSTSDFKIRSKGFDPTISILGDLYFNFKANQPDFSGPRVFSSIGFRNHGFRADVEALLRGDLFLCASNTWGRGQAVTWQASGKAAHQKSQVDFVFTSAASWDEAGVAVGDYDITNASDHFPVFATQY